MYKKKVLGFKTHDSLMQRGLFFALAFFLVMWQARADNSFPFVINVSVDNPMQYLPTSGPAIAHLSATVSPLPTAVTPPITPSGTYTYSWVQLQDGLNPQAVDAAGKGKVTIQGATAPTNSVSLPVPGVYEFQVTVTDAKNSKLTAIGRTGLIFGTINLHLGQIQSPLRPAALRLIMSGRLTPILARTSIRGSSAPRPIWLQ